VAKSETILEIHPFSPLALDQTKSLEAFSENVATLTGGEIQFRIAKSVRSTKPFEKN
jgi:hypothetical protein